LGTIAASTGSGGTAVAFAPGSNYGYAVSSSHLSPIGPCY
jgi:hypothetical protein